MRPRQIVDAAVQRWGRIDFLINNAGVGSPKPLHETDDDIPGPLPRADAARTVPVGPRRDAAHGPGFGDHQHHLDIRGRRRTARRRVLGGQGRADGADHPHRLPVRAHRASAATRWPPASPSRRWSSTDSRTSASARSNRDDAAHAAGPRRGHRQHHRVPVLAGRQIHQRPDDRRRRRLEFDQVPVRTSHCTSEWVARMNLFALSRPGGRPLRRSGRGLISASGRCDVAELRDRALRLAGSIRGHPVPERGSRSPARTGRRSSN